jgi:cation diffusion facilitator family transporter
MVACIGLAVNLLCAWLLRDDHGHHQGHSHHAAHHHDHAHSHPHPHEHAHHGHDHGHGGHAHGGDNNLRGAYLHVLADALTSVLAIVALVLGSLYGWNWMDPAMGVVGALVIARWSWGLIRDAGAVLLDYVPAGESLPDEIRAAIETGGDQITDLHIWQLGPGHHGAIVALRSTMPQAPDVYKAKLAGIDELSHVTVEVQAA